MDDEMREALKALEVENSIKQDEFTVRDAVGIWCPTYSGTQKRLLGMTRAGLVTARVIYDPRVKRNVRAYKKV